MDHLASAVGMPQLEFLEKNMYTDRNCIVPHGMLFENLILTNLRSIHG